MQVKELIEMLKALDGELVIHVQDPFSDDLEDYLLDDMHPIVTRGDWAVLQLGERTEGEL